MGRSFSLRLLASLLLAGSLAAAAQQQQKAPGKVFRWVDENGEVHYSESLPPDIKDLKHDVLDRQGMVRQSELSLAPPSKPAGPAKRELPRDSSGAPRPEALYTDQQLQQQQDAYLLLRYESEQEIADAMEVEVKQLAYDERLLTTSRNSTMQAYRANVREAADRQRAGNPLEAGLEKKIAELERQLDSNAASLAGLKQREEAIRKEFGDELLRYRQLTAEPAGEEG